jgi:hypothetical protein
MNDFGGNATTAWGHLFNTLFQTGPNSAQKFITNFRRPLNDNPCRVTLGNLTDTIDQLMRH